MFDDSEWCQFLLGLVATVLILFVVFGLGLTVSVVILLQVANR